MVLLEFSMSPMTKGETVSAYVARSLDIVDKSGLPYQLTPMGTIIEGDIDEIFAVLRNMHEVPFGKGAQRVSTLIKIDDRRDQGQHGMQGKVDSVVGKLKPGNCA